MSPHVRKQVQGRLRSRPPVPFCKGTPMSDTSGDVDDALDAALELTFPASDPIAVFIHDYDAWDGSITHVEWTARTGIARDERGGPVVPLRFRA